MDLLFTTISRESPEDVERDLWVVPGPSAVRIERDVNLEKVWDGPYKAKGNWVSERTLSNAEVRAKEKVQAASFKPLTSRSAKVRGNEGLTLPTHLEEEAGARLKAVTDDEIRRSLIVLGKSTKIEPSDPHHVDPDLLWTKAPGFPGGITLSSLKSAADAQLEAERKQRIQAEKAALQKAAEADEEEVESTAEASPEARSSEDLQNTPAYPEQPKQVTLSIPVDDYSKASDKKWAIIDESDVSNFHAEVPQLAIQYPFELDLFQKRAVRHLEKGESVFVAAHTSAGKTVVAEYAIALALEQRTRLIYTSPIKALSNQKYRDFVEKFGADKVGLLTGDNSVNPEAPCVIMTTEILRSMLYRGAEMIRDIAFVVFDEVHYVSDADRGVIWEEVIIMLPLNVHVVMLSATTPNALEFSNWVGRNRREPVYIVTTEKRPVPLEHYLYVDEEMFKVLDSSNRFIREGHSAAEKSRIAKDPFAEVPGRAASDKLKRGEQMQNATRWAVTSGGGSRNQKQGEGRWLALVRNLEKKKLLPAIIFTFSKKKVEERAAILSKLDLITAKEKSAAHIIMAKALSRLQEADRHLPQIRRVAQYLQKGIGIHHGGLLPLLKEVVEICFTSGLVRVLLATETFAMGVNAPCRTVVFGDLRKHDGNEFRDLQPGEYIQMCGRAGRRGLDTVGTVIILCEDQIPPLQNLTEIMSGRTSKLQSRFRLRYSMILNLLRTENMGVSDMMKRSFSESAHVSTLGSKYATMKQLRKEIKVAKNDLVRYFKSISVQDGVTVEEVVDYHAKMADVTTTVTKVAQDLLSEIHGKRAQEELLRPGRVIQVCLSDLKVYSAFGAIVQESMRDPVSGERVYIAVIILPENFELPLNAPTLVAPSASVTTNPPGKSISGGLHVLAGKRKKNDDDDDDEFAVKRGGKTGGKQVVKAPPVFFERGAKPALSVSAASASRDVKSAQSDALPRATFGEFISDDLGAESSKAKLAVVRINLNEIERITSLYIERGVSRDIAQKIALERSEHDAGLVAKNLAKKLLSLDDDHFCSLDMVREMKVTQVNIVERWKQAEAKREHVQSTSFCHKSLHRNELRALAERVSTLITKLKDVQSETSDQNLRLFPDFVARLEVLRELKYLNSDESTEFEGFGEGDTLELKGRVACEINTCDELLLSEMVFDNVFNPLDPAEAIALLSCLVLQAKSEDEVQPSTRNLADALDKTVLIATKLKSIQEERGVFLNSDNWVNTVFNPALAEVVYEWAKGRPFAALTEMTMIEEGTIVRTITRLDETCREVKNIARLIGDPDLLQKMEAASQAIKRDIVFATSLYVG